MSPSTSSLPAGTRSGSGPDAAPHVVVLGFGPVAARLVDELSGHVASSRLRLTVVGTECVPAYQRIKIGDVSVGRAAPEDLALADEAELRAAGVEVRCGVTATAVHAASRIVTLDDGGILHYDKLVLATGAEPTTPRMTLEMRRDGHIDAELTMKANGRSAGRRSRAPQAQPEEPRRYPDGVMALRDLDDARRILTIVQRREPVVVLGGGVLGVEAALAIAEVGGAVTLLHRGTVPMGRQIDTDSGMLLRRQLLTAGVDVRSACDVNTVVADDGRLSAVRTSLGEKIETSLLLTCTGVRPRDGLAHDAGLPTAWGITVDRQSRSTGDPHVFAVGDCAAVEGRDPSGLIAPGWEQAEAAAEAIRTDLELAAAVERDAAGRPVDLAGSMPPAAEDASTQQEGTTTTRKLDVILVKSRTLSVACAGETAVDPWDPESPTVSTWSDPKAGQYLRIVTEDERLLGFVAVGMPRSAAELALHCTRGTLPVADRTALLAAEHATKEAELGPDDVLCRCSGATARQVEEAASCCSTVEEVGAACRAGTGCGTCHRNIEKMLESAAEPAEPAVV
ncbi:FAD-dependent oxidoreductase [Nesterenkonia sp. HG001]|uniref:FAD-dependent oxidoreductase n=1 Tax=Nesterenkonia sp. HG001 TaxID=2983207 RepID=UPI002AC6F76E|nr:FAD-dependent oxidoreductase [Nesterenkonia sp. HG001]MDZ5077591.1 FAD-dependent oxidoreductase [Nesterenkonia sp. HG001]